MNLGLRHKRVHRYSVVGESGPRLNSHTDTRTMKRLFRHFLTFCFVCSTASLTFVFNPLLILTAQLPFELYNGDFFGIAFGVSIGVAAGFGGFVAQRPWRDSRSLYKRWRGITAVAALAAGAVSGIGFWGEVWATAMRSFRSGGTNRPGILRSP